MEEAEAAARARIESDLAVQERRLNFARWQRELEQETQQEQAKIADETTQEKVNGAGVHPVLGPAIIDLEYKRVHLVSAKTLSTIPVWEKQRIYRHDRAKLMASDKAKTQNLGLPGVILLHEVRILE
jgi:hypothetical protein